MAWQDRDYSRESDYSGPLRPAPARGLLRRHSVVTILIWTNIAVFVLCTITGGARAVYGSPVTSALAFFTPAIQQGQVWRLITSQYVHWDGWHIILNMLGLHFLGRQLEIDWGSRRFLGVYTISGLVGNLFLLFLTLMGWFNPEAPAAGASGCVLGLLGAAAVRYPQAEVLIYFLFPIKIRTAAIIFAALYALNIYSQGSNAGGDACHIAGLGFGAWWAYRGERWWDRKGFSLPRFRSRKPYRRPTASSPFQERVEQRRTDAVTVDRILKKVYESGIHSLTESEKQALREATERQKAMES